MVSVDSQPASRRPRTEHPRLCGRLSSEKRRFSCDIDTDEIQVDVAAGTPRLGDLSSKAPFAELVGMTLEYAWQLTNHRGYRDAWQMRFLSLESRTETSMQFEVMASAIHVSLVTRA